MVMTESVTCTSVRNHDVVRWYVAELVYRRAVGDCLLSIRRKKTSFRRFYLLITSNHLSSRFGELLQIGLVGCGLDTTDMESVINGETNGDKNIYLIYNAGVGLGCPLL